MTPEQFQAWFEGFAEALDGPPDAEQWRKVCEKVGQIGNLGQPLTFTRPEDVTMVKMHEDWHWIKTGPFEWRARLS